MDSQRDSRFLPPDDGDKGLDIGGDHLVLRGFRVFGELHHDEPVLVVAAVEEDGLLGRPVAPVGRWVIERRVSRPGCRLQPRRHSPRRRRTAERLEDGDGEAGGRKRRRKG